MKNHNVTITEMENNRFLFLVKCSCGYEARVHTQEAANHNAEVHKIRHEHDL